MPPRTAPTESHGAAGRPARTCVRAAATDRASSASWPSHAHASGELHHGVVIEERWAVIDPEIYLRPGARSANRGRSRCRSGCSLARVSSRVRGGSSSLRNTSDQALWRLGVHPARALGPIDREWRRDIPEAILCQSGRGRGGGQGSCDRRKTGACGRGSVDTRRPAPGRRERGAADLASGKQGPWCLLLRHRHMRQPGRRRRPDRCFCARSSVAVPSASERRLAVRRRWARRRRAHGSCRGWRDCARRPCRSDGGIARPETP